MRAHVAAQLGRYIAAGGRHVVCRIGALGLPAQLEQLERIADVPLPHVTPRSRCA